MTRRTASESVTGMHVLTPISESMSAVAGGPDNPLNVMVTNRSEIQKVSITNPGLTNAQLRGEPLQVALTFPATQPVSGTVNVGNLPAVQPVSGTVGVSSLPAVSIAGTVPVSGPVTDAQLRSTPLPITGTVTLSNPTPQGLTDAQLRATPILAKSVAPDLFGTAVTGTVTTTAQTIGALAASLWTAGATHVVAVAAGALVPLLGAVALPALSGASTILSPKGQPLMTQAEAAVVGVKVTVGTGTVVIYGYK